MGGVVMGMELFMARARLNHMAAASGGITPVGATPFSNPTSVTLPAGCQSGDFVLFGVDAGPKDTTTPPSGAITSLALQTWYTYSVRMTGQWGYFLTQADVTAGVVNFATDHAYGVAAVYRGVKQANPFNVLPTLPPSPNATASPVTASAASITTTAANCMLVFCGLIATNSSAAGSFTPPSGFAVAATDFDNPQFGIAFAHALQATAGPSGAVAAQFDNGSGGAGSGFLVALNPA